MLLLDSVIVPEDIEDLPAGVDDDDVPDIDLEHAKYTVSFLNDGSTEPELILGIFVSSNARLSTKRHLNTWPGCCIMHQSDWLTTQRCRSCLQTLMEARPPLCKLFQISCPAGNK